MEDGLSGPRVRDLGEFGLIDRIAGIVGASDAIVGIGDDAAVLEGPHNQYLLATVDMLVQDTHFRLPGMEPEDLGATAVAVNVSDIAAMGGTPSNALLSIAIPPDTGVHFIERVCHGLTEYAHHYGVSIVGGNTTQTSGPLTIDVVLMGHVPRNEVVLRRGAIPGDVLAVTGMLGGRSALRLAHDLRLPNLPPLRPPEARVAVARALAAEHLVHAMMDISDGLGGDLPHLCAASGVGGIIYEWALPIAPITARLMLEVGADENLALSGGEDYELLIAMPRQNVDAATAAAGGAGLTVIGKVVDASQGITVESRDGQIRALGNTGWRHF